MVFFSALVAKEVFEATLPGINSRGSVASGRRPTRRMASRCSGGDSGISEGQTLAAAFSSRFARRVLMIRIVSASQLAWTELTSDRVSEVSCWPSPAWHTALRDFRHRLFVSGAWR
jgi:hypothetical protein